MVHLPSCQLHMSVNRTAQIYLELHFCVELHSKKSPEGKGGEGREGERGAENLYVDLSTV